MWPFARLIVIVSWLVYGARWIAGAPRARRRVNASPCMAAATWTAVRRCCSWCSRSTGTRAPKRTARLTSAAGAALTVAGLVVSIRARNELGRNWSSDAALVERQELVTTGPYSRVPGSNLLRISCDGRRDGVGSGDGGHVFVVTVQAAFRLESEAEDFLAAEYGPAYRRIGSGLARPARGSSQGAVQTPLNIESHLA